MCPSPSEDMPEEFRPADADRAGAATDTEPAVLSDEQPVEFPTLGNGWLLLGIFLLAAVGVLMLLIFASGGNADSSMML